MGEFELIRKHFLPVAQTAPAAALVLGPGDDCAIQRVPAQHELVFSIDTMVEGVHFPSSYPADRLAWRALAAAASDLAAMGADPVCFTLAVTLPAAEEPWLSAFSRGLASASQAFGLALAGGDTTRGPLTVTLQVHGVVPVGQALRRDGARAGDLICVSGTLGDAGAALDYLATDEPTPDQSAVLARYHRPRPRLALGQSLIGRASAAIDVSDGLLADLQHLLDASAVGATVELSKIPLSPALRHLKGEQALRFALHSGDDYELCVTLAPANWQALPDREREALTVIGTVESARGLRLQGDTGAAGDAGGFDHFRRDS